ncbi:hypothetical protein O4J56_22495 [Nocardiopsis sp. RSe5-2]|uniref:MFS transporter n=1 Tax=Nocardiopsis endophytica TaxID=3018445 RepID=A0ABT4U905_9ACTN|nr:hypothetical protein [Nocardiopsis endophytica]MDA2813433.1 hypothetical protein [Nocardiopsis endophytica]
MAGPEKFRTVRAGVFASVSVGVSAAGHAAMSGHAIPAAGPLGGFLLLFALAWAAADDERGLAGICGLMLWGQLALHLLFSYVQAGAGHHHAGAAEMGSAATDGGAGMTAAHIVAALISGWWLRQGEAALFGLLRLLGLLILPVLLVEGSGAAAATPPPSERRPDRGDGGRITRGLRHTVVLRGPPLCC